MKSLVLRPGARVAAVLSAATLGVSCLAGAAAAAPATAEHPDAGNGFAISLAESSSLAYVGSSVTLTATTNTDVGPTPYFITV